MPRKNELITRLQEAGPLALRQDRVAHLARQAEELEASDSQAAIMAAGRLPRVQGSIAVIPVRGVMYYQDVTYSWIASMPRIGRAVDAAMANEEIGGVIYLGDTPGGTVWGTPELTDKIYGYRGTKPQVTVVEAQIASAGYYALTAADQVVLTKSGEVGSIGVWNMHVDQSKMLDEWGLDITLISAGKYKVEGHPFGPLEEEAREEMQRGVDDAYKDFLSAVARNRDTTVSNVRDNFGQGRMLESKRALELSMVDRIGSLGDVLQGMQSKAGSKGRMSADRDGELGRIIQAAYLSVDAAALISEEERRQRDLDELALAEAEGEAV